MRRAFGAYASSRWLTSLASSSIYAGRDLFSEEAHCTMRSVAMARRCFCRTNLVATAAAVVGSCNQPQRDEKVGCSSVPSVTDADRGDCPLPDTEGGDQGADATASRVASSPPRDGLGQRGKDATARELHRDFVIRVRNQQNGPVSVQPLKSFGDVAEDLPPWLNRGIGDLGYSAPTAVQAHAIPLLLEGRDVVGIAPTGSGKTVAFAIPALATLSVSAHRSHHQRHASQRAHEGAVHPRVIVLCPTRELVVQTKKVFETLSSGAVSVFGVFGGQDRDTQLKYLHKQGGDVLIATPGRLCDFIEARQVSLSRVAFFVLDEGDRMLELGFSKQLKFIVDSLPQKTAQAIAGTKAEGESEGQLTSANRVTMLWSATWSPVVERLASGLLNPRDRLTIEVSKPLTLHSDIEQRLYAVDDRGAKIRKIVELYDQQEILTSQKVLVFTNLKESTEAIVEDLTRALGANNNDVIQALHGGMKQSRREAVLRRFSEGSIAMLVATDIAARGIDVPDVEHVINFDIPSETDRFVHRIGRTGRAGKKGKAHTFFSREDGGQANDLALFLEKKGVSVPSQVWAVLGNSRWAPGQRQFHRFGRVPVTSSVAGSENWRGGGSANGMASSSYLRSSTDDQHHSRRSSGRRPTQVFVLKRDAPPSGPER